MTLELYADVSYTDSANQSVQITVTEVETGDSETVTGLPSGYYGHELKTIGGDIDYQYEVLVETTSSDPTLTPTVKDVDVAIPGDIGLYEQNRLKTEVSWDETVIDYDEATFEPHEYTIQLIGVDDVVAKFRPKSVSYSPSVESAKDASFDAEPFDWLEDNRFLGADCILYIDNVSVFNGKVKEITTNQDDDDYSITAKSRAKGLREESVNFAADTMLMTDTLARIFDNANDVDSQFIDATQTDTETISNLERNLDGSLQVVSGQTSGTADYYEVGKEAIRVNVIYVKAYAPGSGIDIEIDDGRNTYSETITNSSSKLGQWHAINPEGLNDAYYDLSFTVHGDSILHNWRAIKNADLFRDVAECACSDSSGYEDNIYTYTSNADEGMPSVTETDRVTPTSNGYKARQKSVWVVINDSYDSTYGGTSSVSGDTVDGLAVTTSGGSWHSLEDYRLSDVSIPAWEIWARVALHNDNGVGSASYQIEMESSNERYNGSIDTGSLSSDTYVWKKIAGYDDNSEFRYDLAYVGKQSSNSPQIRGMDSTDDDVYFGEFVAIAGEDADVSWEYEFAEGLTNGHVDSPMMYDQGSVSFEPYDLPENLINAETTITVSGSTDVQGEWGPIQTSDIEDWNYEQLPNSVSTTDVITKAGRQHAVKVFLDGYGERNNGTPRLGYQGQELTEVNVNATYSNLPVVYEKDIADNPLSAATTLVSNTRYTFRFEGDTINIFERGSTLADVELKSESIQSTRSIEDVISSVEVIGRDGVTSGIIHASNAPEYIDEHREIQEPSVKTKSQAVAQAEEYLRENSDIEYTADIETLPTLAPLGDRLPGSMFAHGEDVIIESVSYSKDSTTISCGRVFDITDELVNLNSSTKDSEQIFTRG